MGILMDTIMRKLKQKETAKKVEFYQSVLNRLADEKYRPHPDDAIMNPLSEFKTVAEKRAAYNRALDNHENVLVSFGSTIPLGGEGAKFNDIEHVGGLWRKQCAFEHDTIIVQDKEFVLLNKLERQEHTGFEFYNAASVTWNAMGKQCAFRPSYIIAKRETNRGVFYAYGCYITEGKNALSKARSHLACKLFDVFQDVFEAEMCPQK